MFSLLITIISIALVAALALATLYYGGTAFNKGSSRAEASKILLQGQQLVGAAELYFTDKREWPMTLEQLVTDKYLKQIPVAGLTPGETLTSAQAAGTAWTMPVGGVPVFVLHPIATDTCLSVNSMSYGVDGILKTARTEYRRQCFGQATSALTVVVGKAGSDLLAVAAAPAGAGAVLGVVSELPAPTDTASTDWLDLTATVAGPVIPPVVVPEVPPVVAPLVGAISFEQGGVPLGALTFPDTQELTSSAAQVVTVRNTGTAPLTFPSAAQVPVPYAVVSDSCAGATLGLDATCSISVSFSPPAAAAYSGASYALALAGTGYDLATLPLQGLGTPTPVAVATVEHQSAVILSLAFPNTPIGSNATPKTVVIRNSGDASMTLAAGALTVTAPFTIAANTCNSITLAPDATCTVEVGFSPTAIQSYTSGYQLTVRYDGTKSKYLTLSSVGTSVGVVQVATYAKGTFIKKSDGSWWAAGDSAYWQLGLGTVTSTGTFTKIVELNGATEVVMSSRSTVARLSNGNWVGTGAKESLGLASNSSKFVALPALNGATKVLLGVYHALARKADGTWVGTGNKFYGTLGLGDSTERPTFVAVAWLGAAVQVVSQENQTFAQMADGTWKAAGNNGQGQLGLGDVTTRTLATVVPGLAGATRVDLGPNSLFARYADGSWAASGNNSNYSLGLGDTTRRTALTPVPELLGATRLIAVGNSSLAQFEGNQWAVTGQTVPFGTSLGVLQYFATLQHLSGALQVQLGEAHSAPEFSSGWAIGGGNSSGQLGQGGSDPGVHAYLTIP